MKQSFVKSWKSSIQPRKQRKYRYNAPYHTLTKFLTVTLSKELRQKQGKRNIPIRVGDKAKILRGSHKGKTGNIERVSRELRKVYLGGIEQTRKDGNKSRVPFEPSNLMITELNLKDKRRIKGEKKSAKETSEKT